MPVSSAIMEPWNKEVVVHNGMIDVSGKLRRPFGQSIRVLKLRTNNSKDGRIPAADAGLRELKSPRMAATFGTQSQTRTCPPNINLPGEHGRHQFLATTRAGPSCSSAVGIIASIPNRLAYATPGIGVYTSQVVVTT